MNSIDREQPEENRKDLFGEEAVAKIREIFERVPTCFFSTRPAAKAEWGTRPMTVQRVEDDGRLLFLSAHDSRHDSDIAMHPEVELFFQASPYSGYLHLHGRCESSRDRTLIKELWKPIFKTWFTEGIDDPRITVLSVAPQRGEYWDNKNGNFVAGIKMMIGAALGKTLDDSISGKLQP